MLRDNPNNEKNYILFCKNMNNTFYYTGDS